MNFCLSSLSYRQDFARRKISLEQQADSRVEIRVGDVRKGMIIFIDDCPCKVTVVSTSKTGKHGHTKASVKGVDVKTNKEHTFVLPTASKIYRPK